MTEVFAGIDVSKARLDVALLPSGEVISASNDDEGIDSLIARFQTVTPTLVVVEATGGLQILLVTALADPGDQCDNSDISQNPAHWEGLKRTLSFFIALS